MSGNIELNYCLGVTSFTSKIEATGISIRSKVSNTASLLAPSTMKATLLTPKHFFNVVGSLQSHIHISLRKHSLC